MLTRAQQLQFREQQLHEKAQQLHEKAQKCRDLADTAMTEEGRSILFEIAQRYEREASTAGAQGKQPALSEAVA